MDAKQVKGLAVVSVNEAQKIGTVDRIFIDPDSRRILGFAVHTSAGSSGMKQALDTILGEGQADPVTTGFVTAEHVRSLGPDAVMINDVTHMAKGQSEPAEATAVTTDELHKRKVVTENGTYVGQIDSVVLDPATMRATHFSVSPGFFKSATDVPARYVTSVGPDLIVVADAVCRQMERGGDEASSRHFVVFEDGRPETTAAGKQSPSA